MREQGDNCTTYILLECLLGLHEILLINSQFCCALHLRSIIVLCLLSGVCVFVLHLQKKHEERQRLVHHLRTEMKYMAL
jgi:hypothetical protein